MPLFHRSEPAPPPTQVEDTHTHGRGGLFNRSKTPPPVQQQEPVHKSGGLFSRSKTPPPVQQQEPVHKSGGLFSRNRHSASHSSLSSDSSRETHNTTSTGRRGLFKREHEDPSIIAARERVVAAERAETEADRALMNARQAVKDARDHVKRLEAEAIEEARRAKIKSEQAAAIGKRGNALGRHDLH